MATVEELEARITVLDEKQKLTEKELAEWKTLSARLETMEAETDAKIREARVAPIREVRLPPPDETQNQEQDEAETDEAETDDLEPGEGRSNIIPMIQNEKTVTDDDGNGTRRKRLIGRLRRV
jgi:hypothetical protein